MVGENSSDGLAYKGMFWDATNTLSASFKHIYIYIYIYIYFVKTIIVLYILIWRFSDKYILIKNYYQISLYSIQKCNKLLLIFKLFL